MRRAFTVVLVGCVLGLLAACGPETTPPPPPPPVADPIVVTGSGDSVVDLSHVVDYPAVARISYSGQHNFIVWTHGPDGGVVDLLVNVIGAYHGNRPLASEADESVATLEITASGPWSFEIVDRRTLPVQPMGATLSSSGDDVLLIGGNPRTLTIDASANTGNFIVIAHTPGWDLLVNEIGAYSGTVLLEQGSDPLAIEVRAHGPWTMVFS